MLMSVLPGLRDLRTPLATGYIWLVSLWLSLPAFGQGTVTKRPDGDGLNAEIWVIAGGLGVSVILAVTGFVAYLVGSFLEVRTDGRIGRVAGRFATSKSETAFVMRVLAELDVVYKAFGYPTPPLNYSDNRDRRRSIARSLPFLVSKQAAADLLDYAFERMAPAPEGDQNVRTDRMPTRMVAEFLREIPQIATRLEVRNPVLFNRYDRFMGEAAFRLNVAPALAIFFALLVTRVRQEGANLFLTSSLALLVGVLCLLLFRQAGSRAKSARDVLVQAISIEAVESRAFSTVQVETSELGVTSKPFRRSVRTRRKGRQ